MYLLVAGMAKSVAKSPDSTHMIIDGLYDTSGSLPMQLRLLIDPFLSKLIYTRQTNVGFCYTDTAGYIEDHLLNILALWSLGLCNVSVDRLVKRDVFIE
jgi:hypothetical protein